MRKYGSLSWKRTWIWSNRRAIACLDLGPMSQSEKKGAQRTTDRYRDRHGKVRFKGNRNLKRSQYLDFVSSVFSSNIFSENV